VLSINKKKQMTRINYDEHKVIENATGDIKSRIEVLKAISSDVSSRFIAVTKEDPKSETLKASLIILNYRIERLEASLYSLEDAFSEVKRINYVYNNKNQKK